MVNENKDRKEYPKRNCVDPGALRMGNWVQHSGSGKPFIWTLEKFYEYYVTPDKSYYYDPIPLTPEILEKAGFRKGKVKGVTSFDSDGDKNAFTYFFDMPVKQSDTVDSFTFSLVKWGRQQKYFTFSFQLLRVRITSVHQLQNLFYSLTGTELNIQL